MKRVNHGRRKFIIPLLAGVGVLFLIGGAYVLKADPFNSSQCKGKTSSPIYDEALTSLSDPDHKNLQAVVEKIKQQKGYETDVNCLYPVMIYHLDIEQISEAEKNLKLLNKTGFDSTSKVSEVYKPIGFTKPEDAQELFNKSVDEKVDNYNQVLF